MPKWCSALHVRRSLRGLLVGQLPVKFALRLGPPRVTVLDIGASMVLFYLMAFRVWL